MEKTLVKEYVDGAGKRVIRDWLAIQDGAVKANVMATLEIVRYRPPDQLGKKVCKPLTAKLGSKCAGLHELIIDGRTDEGARYCCRIIGFWGPGANDFTMLRPMDKGQEGNAYRSACQVAHQRMNDVKANWARAFTCDDL